VFSVDHPTCPGTVTSMQLEKIIHNGITQNEGALDLSPRVEEDAKPEDFMSHPSPPSTVYVDSPPKLRAKKRKLALAPTAGMRKSSPICIDIDDSEDDSKSDISSDLEPEPDSNFAMKLDSQGGGSTTGLEATSFGDRQSTGQDSGDKPNHRTIWVSVSVPEETLMSPRTESEGRELGTATALGLLSPEEAAGPTIPATPISQTDIDISMISPRRTHRLSAAQKQKEPQRQNPKPPVDVSTPGAGNPTTLLLHTLAHKESEDDSWVQLREAIAKFRSTVQMDVPKLTIGRSTITMHAK